MNMKRHCSFCDRDEYQVRKMIAASNNVYICDECVEICANILGESLRKEVCCCCKQSSPDVNLIYDPEIDRCICEECLDSFIELYDESSENNDAEDDASMNSSQLSGNTFNDISEEEKSEEANKNCEEPTINKGDDTIVKNTDTEEISSLKNAVENNYKDSVDKTDEEDDADDTSSMKNDEEDDTEDTSSVKNDEDDDDADDFLDNFKNVDDLLDFLRK